MQWCYFTPSYPNRLGSTGRPVWISRCSPTIVPPPRPQRDLRPMKLFVTWTYPATQTWAEELIFSHSGCPARSDRSPQRGACTHLPGGRCAEPLASRPQLSSAELPSAGTPSPLLPVLDPEAHEVLIGNQSAAPSQVLSHPQPPRCAARSSNAAQDFQPPPRRHRPPSHPALITALPPRLQGCSAAGDLLRRFLPYKGAKDFCRKIVCCLA